MGKCTFKALCIFKEEIQSQNFNIYNLKYVNNANKLLNLENKVPRQLFEARKVTVTNTYKEKQYAIMLSFKVSYENNETLFIQFVDT